MPEPVFDYQDELRGWARILHNRLTGHEGVRAGFMFHLVEAALAADDRNLSYLEDGFPLLVRVLRDYREYGPMFLQALAYWDWGTMADIYGEYLERDLAAHERSLAELGGK